MLTFTVRGTPATKGSMRGRMAFVKGKGWRTFLFHDNERTGTWQTLVRDGAAQARARIRHTGILYPKPIPVTVIAEFVLPCPIKLRKRADSHPTTKPDADKLIRLVFDALTGIAYTDDAQVVQLQARKRYVTPGEDPGVVVTVTGGSDAHV